MFWFSPFWVLPTATLTSSAAAVAIGTINMFGNIAGAIGSPIVGMIKDAAGGDTRGGNVSAMLFVAACFALGAVFVSLLRVPHGRGATGS
jgi:ACS family tartrate transporter-like MFS transporter